MIDGQLGEQNPETVARFNRVGAGYDGVSRRYLSVVAERLVELTGINKGANVLDAGSDRGAVAIRAAEAAGSRGHVVGLGISKTMLEQARRAIEEAAVLNVELREMDGEHLDFPDGSFDAVTWGLSVFLLPDLIAGLRKSWRVVKPGGSIGVSIPGPTSMEPMRAMYLTRLKSYGVPPAHGESVEPQAHHERTGRDQAALRQAQDERPVDTPETCYDALREGGFERIEVRAEQFGCYLANAAEWWEIVRSMGLGSFHARLSRTKLSRLKADHLAEVAKLATSDGIWLDLAVIFAVGWKQS